MKVESHVPPMQARVSLLVLLVVGAAVLAGCGGKGSDSSSSSTTGLPTTGSPASSGPTIVTVTQTTTISGTLTAVTNTITQTETTSGAPPGPVPEINNITVKPAANSASIAWEVSAGTGALTSHAEYGYASLVNYTASTGPVGGPGSQSATLTGLVACSDYKVRIAASDASGTTVRTDAKLFTTTAGPVLAASAVSVPPASVTDTGFKVQWTIAGPADAKSHVEYGLNSGLGASTPDAMGIGAKSAVITGLSAGQTYNYKVVASSPCPGGATFPATGALLQKTAIVVYVDINQGASASGAVNSFSPGSTVTGSLKVVKDQPYVFEITNKDTSPTAVTHTFFLTDSGGTAIGYNSPDITGGNPYHFPVSVIFTDLGTGKYLMACAHHNMMKGTIDVAAS